MSCEKCRQVMRLKYVSNTDGTFKLVWRCPDCRHEEFATGRVC